MPRHEIILGIQYGGHDTAAGLTVDGRVVAACEQERYTHDKHSRRFPKDAIADCLKKAGIGVGDVDEIGFCFDPFHYIRETYLKTALEGAILCGPAHADGSPFRRLLGGQD
jgi:carbamoyltransferase